MGQTAALIVAAGRGERFGGALPKQYQLLDGQPILRRTLRVFLDHPRIDALRVVINPADRALYDEASHGLSVLDPVAGGETRQASVRNGLESLRDLDPDRVLIHDAARPFVSHKIIDQVIAALETSPGAIAAVPVTDSVKRANGSQVAGVVARDGLWRAQTPQGFRYSDILSAHLALAGEDLTDDAAVAERAGMRVALVESSAENFKVTTPEDRERAERYLASLREYRSGHGYDVHRFGPGDHLWLCGVKISHSSGLVGHSDADVGLHALTDALLGAIAEGDLGDHFPPSDPQWRGAASHQFLRYALELLRAKGGRVVNADVTLICEVPKVGPHRQAMRARIAEILEIEPERISVKATTTEELGFTGRREGIAAQASVTVAMPGGKR